MRRSLSTLLFLLFVLIVAACSGEAPESSVDPVAERSPQGSEEAQTSFEGFLDSPFISDSQAASTRDMVWSACAAFAEGVTWQEFEEQTKADAEAQGTPLSALELAGMRTAAGLGILAYCPEHSDKGP